MQGNSSQRENITANIVAPVQRKRQTHCSSQLRNQSLAKPPYYLEQKQLGKLDAVHVEAFQVPFLLLAMLGHVMHQGKETQKELQRLSSEVSFLNGQLAEANSKWCEESKKTTIETRTLRGIVEWMTSDEICGESFTELATSDDSGPQTTATDVITESGLPPTAEEREASCHKGCGDATCEEGYSASVVVHAD